MQGRRDKRIKRGMWGIPKFDLTLRDRFRATCILHGVTMRAQLTRLVTRWVKQNGGGK